VVYTAADEYSIGLPPEKKWLSKGVRDIRSVLGYPGTITPSRRSHLIVLVGFEADRALELIESYEPNVLSLGFGEEASAVGPHHQAINRLAFRQIASKVIHYTEFNFSATSPFDAEIALKEQIKLRPDCNVLVAPMNTKLSTIGAAAVAFRDDNIRLCYASAMTYNVDNYSRAADYCYLTNIPFDFWRWPERKTATSDISIAKLWTKGANRVAEFVH
jgi:hypothetical protein